MGSVFSVQICVCAKICEIGLFRKMPFSRHIAHFFGHPSLRPFFWLGALLACHRNVDEVDARETLRNKGFRTDFASFFLFDSCSCFTKPRFCGPISTIIFSACYYLSKMRWGCRAEVVFKSVFFGVVSGARIFDARRARGRDNFLLGLASVPKMASPLRCGGFSRLFRLFLATLFRKLQVVLFTPPSFCLGVFSFVRLLLGIGGNAALHVCFWAVGLQPSYFCLVFRVFLQKHCFSLKKGYFGSFLGVSLSFSLASFTSLCHSLFLFFFLSLSLYLSLSFSFLLFPFLVVLSLFLPSLFFGCSLLSCFFAFVSWKEQHEHITFASLIS